MTSSTRGRGGVARDGTNTNSNAAISDTAAGSSGTSTTTPGPITDEKNRPSTTRNVETIIKRALEDQSNRIDDLRGRVDEALRDDAIVGGGYYRDDNYLAAGALGLGLGYASGFYDGFYDPGFYGAGFGGFGAFGAQGTVFQDPCCASGFVRPRFHVMNKPHTPALHPTATRITDTIFMHQASTLSVNVCMNFVFFQQPAKITPASQRQAIPSNKLLAVCVRSIK